MKSLAPALFALTALTVTACTSTSSSVSTQEPLDLAAPGKAVDALVRELDAGRFARAESLFLATSAPDAGGEAGAETLYPPLFQVARDRYGAGDHAGSSRVLSFMASVYPDAVSVREALVFSLFLERSALDAPDDALARQLDDALAGLRESALRPPVWTDLVEAQCAIDRGDLEGARSAFERFRSAWNEQPSELAVYVDDLERYLYSG